MHKSSLPYIYTIGVLFQLLFVCLFVFQTFIALRWIREYKIRGNEEKDSPHSK